MAPRKARTLSQTVSRRFHKKYSVLQDVLGKDVVKIGFPPAKNHLKWVSMEKSTGGEQMLVCKVP